MSSLLRMFTLISLFTVLIPDYTLASSHCFDNGHCEFEGRSYQIKVPKNWDGKSPLPVLLHFHGWGRTGRNVVNNTRITAATDNNGFLLIAPNGLGKSWDFWGKKSRDTTFAQDLLNEVSQNWPIDKDKVFVSGFSYGSAMAWRFACDTGSKLDNGIELAGILPIAGTLWQQSEIVCKGGPTNVSHVHGLKDNVMNLPAGTKTTPQKGIELWQRTNGCEITPDHKEKIDIFTCYHWTGCNSGKETSLCLHKYGHQIPKGWLNLILAKVIKNS